MSGPHPRDNPMKKVDDLTYFENLLSRIARVEGGRERRGAFRVLTKGGSRSLKQNFLLVWGYPQQMILQTKRMNNHRRKCLRSRLPWSTDTDAFRTFDNLHFQRGLRNGLPCNRPCEMFNASRSPKVSSTPPCRTGTWGPIASPALLTAGC